MTPPSPSTPSEGEIIESDSEKATTSLRSLNGTKVDRKSRIRVSSSRSPSPCRSPRRHLSRSPSRSPYRESRGVKRRREDEHCNDRARRDSRRFNSRYESWSAGGRRALRDSYDDLDRSREPRMSIHYEERANLNRATAKTSWAWNGASFRSKPGKLDHGHPQSIVKDAGSNSYGWDTRFAEEYEERSTGLSREQSVSDWGQIPIATTPTKRNAENRFNQTQMDTKSKKDVKKPIAEYVFQAFLLHFADDTVNRNDPKLWPDSRSFIQPVDEAALIEERRKKREAIKAKHRGRSTPMLVQALASGKETVSNSSSNFLPNELLASGNFHLHLLIIHTDGYS